MIWLILAALQVAGMAWAWCWLGSSEGNDGFDRKRLFWAVLWPFVWLAHCIGRI